MATTTTTAAASKYLQKRRHSRLDANEPIEDVFAGIKFEKIKKTVPVAAKSGEDETGDVGGELKPEVTSSQAGSDLSDENSLV